MTQGRPSACRLTDVRINRVAVESGDRTFALDLSPRVTVVAGVSRLERDGLVNELIGALNSERAGVHLELTDDDGNHLAVFRPHGGRHRVIDVTHGTDVTGDYDHNGTIDLLASLGLDPYATKRLMRLDATELKADVQASETIARLALGNQQDLWGAAHDVGLAANDLRDAAAEAGTTPEDADVVERIEEQHTRQKEAEGAHERVRRLSFFISAVSIIGAVPLAILEGNNAAGPFILFAAVSAAISLGYRLRWNRARSQESAVLDQAGADSYLGFHLQRVETLLSGEQQRRRLMAASDAHRHAVANWEELAGDITVDWAVEHRPQIENAAERHQTEEIDAPTTVDMSRIVAESLITRLKRLAAIDGADRSLPLVLDEPFVGLDIGDKSAIVDLLEKASQSLQIILLTEDPETVAWSQAASGAGAIVVIDPTTTGVTQTVPREPEAAHADLPLFAQPA
jgi:hypothetical protein